MWWLSLLSFLLSAGITAAVIHLAQLKPSLFMDTAIGPQKFHDRPTPRIGGIAIFIAFAIAVLIHEMLFRSGEPSLSPTVELLACSLVVVAAGLGEDITKKIGAGVRLSAAMLAGGLAFYFADAQILRLDVWFLDQLLHWRWFALLMTAFAVAGISNAINIIDGYNGLSGGYAVLALGAIGIVAARVGDQPLVAGCLLLASAIIGFLVWNFPYGRIFLGDAGAYFVGFMLAEYSVLLVFRHPEVSPWFPLLVVAYPVWETLFSIYRKRFVRGISPGQPDGLHFHMLVYKRVVPWRRSGNKAADRVHRNATTSPYLWMLSAIPLSAAVLFWDNSLWLACLGFAFGGLYNLFYRRIVRFNIPRWTLRSRRSRVADEDESETASL